MIDKDITETLLTAAQKVKNRAYAPYSHYQVGAALLTKSGQIYVGCNIENASYGATNCAERTALFSAIASGEKDFEAIALVGGYENQIDGHIVPCGICCQALSEFCDKDFLIIIKNEESYRTIKLQDLFPYAFSSQNLK